MQAGVLLVLPDFVPAAAHRLRPGSDVCAHRAPYPTPPRPACLQLRTACDLELWAEAFRTVEDIQGLVALTPKGVKVGGRLPPLPLPPQRAPHPPHQPHPPHTHLEVHACAPMDGTRAPQHAATAHPAARRIPARLSMLALSCQASSAKL